MRTLLAGSGNIRIQIPIQFGVVSKELALPLNVRLYIASDKPSILKGSFLKIESSIEVHPGLIAVIFKENIKINICFLKFSF